MQGLQVQGMSQPPQTRGRQGQASPAGQPPEHEGLLPGNTITTSREGLNLHCSLQACTVIPRQSGLYNQIRFKP